MSQLEMMISLVEIAVQFPEDRRMRVLLRTARKRIEVLRIRRNQLLARRRKNLGLQCRGCNRVMCYRVDPDVRLCLECNPLVMPALAA